MRGRRCVHPNNTVRGEGVAWQDAHRVRSGSSGKYHVYDQYPASGSDVTLFECKS